MLDPSTRSSIVRNVRSLVFVIVAVGALATAESAFAQVPPPEPSAASFIGEVVTNPAIDPLIGVNITTVNGLDVSDLSGGSVTQFVLTEDDWAFMVQPVGVRLYRAAEFFVDILSITPGADAYTSPIATVQNEAGHIMDLLLWQTRAQWESSWNYQEAASGEVVDPVIEGGVNGKTVVFTGAPGQGGRSASLFWRPSNGEVGGDGHDLPLGAVNNNDDVLATDRIGFKVGSQGGNGGDGGDSWFNVFPAGDGGNGGVGGFVGFTNNAQIATQSDSIGGLHGVFAFSQSGRGGAGGEGYIAPAGGSGGASPNGGDVTVINNGLISTDSEGAHGIHALSGSGNAGGGGTSWGLVGTAGSGGLAGDGGTVSVTNSNLGLIITERDFSHGISAQSIGGTGGSAGYSGNLLFNLTSQGQAGGNAGSVVVMNEGSIWTFGDNARGIQALSNGGGGGDQGGSYGLVALGGQSAAGGNGGEVQVINTDTGYIHTSGVGSDAVYAQSVGGSGGSNSDSNGLVALGGDGAVAGDGGAVTVENYGSIVTSQANSMGIFAESVGGGGGDGGSTTGFVSVGGRGGAGGSGSTVQVTNGGSISTSGDNSGGIFAQSVGGGGGNGASSESNSLFTGYSVGGNGGDGGDGGNVTIGLTSAGSEVPISITTSGASADGVFAQSVGGGGGTGGGTAQWTLGAVGAASVSLGGAGGAAADGGDVTLTAGTGLTSIATQGAFSEGVVLQSVGGTGGDAGSSVAASLAGGPIAGSLSVGQGGTGGEGGSAGLVLSGEFGLLGEFISSGFNGSILTDGEFSTGFLAQSTGGGGGNAGLTVTDAAGIGGFTGSVAITLGASGGGAGHGGVVQIGLAADITTLQDKSIGLLAQSVGGGGGNGGATISATIAAGAGAVAGQFSMGGSGGEGGVGGNVTLATRSNLIQTSGSDSAGVVVQSGGGGGGTGGYTSSDSYGGGAGAGAISVGIGGSGGSGGAGGTVVADLQSDVITLGDRSGGVFAQSIGGGGGLGGYSISNAYAGAGAGAAAVAVGLGGTGGDGGHGGEVTLTYAGSVSTAGTVSNGVTAQSIGGGGGVGGYSVNLGLAGAGVGSGAITVGLGGSGGTASHGALVIADVLDGLISTSGSDSVGVLAQSVGGGGGAGGYSVATSGTAAGVGAAGIAVGLGGSGGGGGNGGEVRLTVHSDIETTGDNSGGFIAQSVGKGGGIGGYNISTAGSLIAAGAAISIGQGGSGGGGGHGGLVIATSTGLIHTVGDKSNGFTAQSLGGGGGLGNYNISVAASAGAGNGAGSVGLGGSGGGAGHGGTVEANVFGDIWTEGQNSIGILAQSVGDGGGDGAYNISAAGAFGVGGGVGLSVGIGGTAGAGGDGGSVTLTVGTAELANNISISGPSSMGIVAQSIGGGGGNGGFNISAALAGSAAGAAAGGFGIGGSGGAGGNGGEVNSTVFANIVNTPDVVGFLTSVESGDGDDDVLDDTASGGLLVQSVGEGGGAGSFNITGAASFSAAGAGAIAVGIGGMGGDGGFASTVTSNFTGTVETSRDGGFGIAVQSVGGGGGVGGINISGAVSGTGGGNGAVAFGLGGSGGGGGAAGEVHNTVETGLGFVHTAGSNATGILAQSVGRGGGAGATNITGAISAAGGGSGAVALGSGGFGGGAGSGGLVVSHVYGGVVTEGANSVAVLAQSLGGDGGVGGMNVTGAVSLTGAGSGAVAIGLGGFGGGGGVAGRVESVVTANAPGQYFMTYGEESSAIVAQSIGGAGGVGATNITGAVSVAGGTGAAVGAGTGGFGGGAGEGGSVLLTVTGDVFTRGSASHGLVAQSVGGDGGIGGLNITGSYASTGSASTGVGSLGVGGFGGAGGNAGAVEANYSGTMVVAEALALLGATGSGSHGIFAQSVGGDGGMGGMNISGGVALRGTHGYGAVLGTGGFGGGGGNGDTVDVTVTGGGSITAYGEQRSAIFAQSLGGSGGDGGMNITGGVTAGNSLFCGVGGFGGDAGSAQKVTVTAVTDLTLYQREYLAEEDIKSEGTAAGLFAQSVGGGGGNGGTNITGGIAFSGASNTLTFGVGGFGGAGAAGGDVEVDLTGAVNTVGQLAHGILAQSIGGGGGNGGMNVTGQVSAGSGSDLGIVAGVGGDGGSASHSGQVDVIHNGAITTFGDKARAVFAQSVSGGGGVGGMNFTGLLTNGVSPVVIGVGGSGGDAGGTAGAVSVTRGSIDLSTGALTTTGEAAHGIEASSLGGGGGDAGMNFTFGLGTGIISTSYAVNISVGGSGGDAGSAGTVTVDNFSDIQTNLKGSIGILAQSIGGGGGNGNFNMGVTLGTAAASQNAATMTLAVGGQPGDGGHATTVDVTQVGDIDTLGDNSSGVVAQSIGGGGGNVGYDFAMSMVIGAKNTTDLSMTLGKVGGSGGTGGAVTLYSDGEVHTRGANSRGLFAQSIGAGGGTSSATTVGISNASVAGDQTTTHKMTVSVGCEGGTGGAAGNVTITAAGRVITEGVQSHGIVAQSVGGGGGIGGGGSAASFTSAAPDIGLAVGGAGGTGGASGKVSVISSADVITGSIDTTGSIGILAQSIGGGGGEGGGTYTGGMGYGAMTASIALGGAGGAGNTSETVDVSTTGLIWTEGSMSHGVLAQSIGGGGGNAGMVANFVLPFRGVTTEPGASVAALLVGGAGGDGALSREVGVTNSGSIVTLGKDSVGILAQSIGGGGGNASAVYSGTIVRTTSASTYTLAIGGDGGVGGSAADVIVQNLTSESAISTLADRSHGIYAMSLGGGGGLGSQVIAADLNVGSSNNDATSIGVTVTLGGDGGEGGSAGRVDILNEGNISTRGERAHGVFAQSVGGGGGTGGYAISGNVQYGGGGFPFDANTGTFAIGGDGGSGNRASAVTVTNTGLIEIFGNSSYGVYAQSVGGGGGDGAFAVVASLNALSLDPFRNLTNVGLGGFGGDGADGGAVTVENSAGAIICHGDDSFGVYAQSVGGGGGNMGWAVSSPAWTVANFILQQSLGGGSDGQGGAVSVHGQGNITMLGDRSKAVFTQSVAGGGGNIDLYLDVSEQAVVIGEDGIIIPTQPVIASSSIVLDLGLSLFSGGDTEAEDAVSDTDGDISTQGDSSVGETTQSIGGGGGSATEEFVVDTLAETEFELAVGGDGVVGGDGGDITDTRDGDLSTLGDDSIGAVIESIGGGGGTAIINVTTVDLPGETGGSATAVVSFGGDATVDSDGGIIGANFTGAVSTEGELAPGLLLQSIGAGGGHATLSGFDAIEATIGGQNAASGNGDSITLVNVGSISTGGALSHGVVLQSIGGGGGAFLSDAPDVTVTASDSNSGNGGNIDFNQSGTVVVQGDGSIGILAQSLGGGGGFINRDFMDTAGGAGTSGTINLAVDGDVYATGQDGIGIFAQSRGGTAQSNIDVSFAGNNAIVVGDSGVGLDLSGGFDNTFVNDGVVFAATTMGNPEGMAVRSAEGNETITNNGIFYGSVDLGGGHNSLTSAEGASVYAGNTLFIGDAADEVFTNHGLLSMGDTTTGYRTDLAGSYVQTVTGQLDVSIDGTDDGVDVLHITHTADLEGKLNIILLHASDLRPGDRRLTFLIADEGIVNENLELVAPESAVAQFSFAAPVAPVLSTVEGEAGALWAVGGGPGELGIEMVVAFVGFGGLNSNQDAFGSYIDRVQAAGGTPELDPMIADLVALPTVADLAAAYDSMSPEVFTSTQQNLELASTRFMETMFGSRQLGNTFTVNAKGEEVASNRTSYLTMDDGTASDVGAPAGSRTFWANTSAGYYNSNQTSQYMGFSTNTVDVSAGVELTFGDEWCAGVAIGYTNYSTNYSDGISTTSDGNSGQVGVYVAKGFGATRLTLGVAGGFSEINTERSNVFAAPGVATSDIDETFISTRFRISHDIDRAGWYIRPYLDLGFASIHNNAFTESGAGAMNLVVDAGTYNVFTVSPAVQVGWEFDCGNLSIRPNASVGYTRYSDAAPSFSAVLQGGPAGVTPFEVYGLNDLNYLDASAGVDLNFDTGAILQFLYSGQFSKNTSAGNFQVRLSFPF